MVAEPTGQTAQAFMELGAAVVREIAKLRLQPRNAVRCAACSQALCCCACLRLSCVQGPGAATDGQPLANTSMSLAIDGLKEGTPLISGVLMPDSTWSLAMW